MPNATQVSQLTFLALLVASICVLYSTLLPAHRTAELPTKQLYTLDTSVFNNTHNRTVPTTLTATGYGVIAVQADRTVITATVQATAGLSHPLISTVNSTELVQSKLKVQKAVAAQTSTVIEYLHSADVAPYIHKLHTAAVALRPNLMLVNNSEYITGYTAANILQFQADVNQSGAILDAIIEHGVTNINFVSFVLSDTLNNRARQQSIAVAVNDALKQLNTVQSTVPAQYVSGATLHIDSIEEVHVTEPVPSSEQSGTVQGLPRMMSAAAMMGPAETTPILGSEISVSATVKVVAELSQ